MTWGGGEQDRRSQRSLLVVWGAQRVTTTRLFSDAETFSPSSYLNTSQELVISTKLSARKRRSITLSMIYFCFQGDCTLQRKQFAVAVLTSDGPWLLCQSQFLIRVEKISHIFFSIRKQNTIDWLREGCWRVPIVQWKVVTSIQNNKPTVIGQIFQIIQNPNHKSCRFSGSLKPWTYF